MAGKPDSLLRIPHLYHFTDVRNLPTIKELDGIYSTAKLREMAAGFKAGGDEQSLQLDLRSGMDQYVHLCFDLRHPMESYIKSRDREANLVYLKIDRAILYQDGVRFSTGVAYAQGVQTFTIEEAQDGNMIDYQVLYTFMPWGDPVVKPRRRAAELCEIFVPDYVSMKFIRNFPNG
ncbi:MAG: DarT ssDNA thymidine ADP-ribosyltransferase family protein [Candidatus Acidiferrum sp.]